MIKFTVKKPPKLSIAFYLIGFVLIIPTVLHQYLSLNWLTPVLNQQIFIAGAIIVALGSVLNWLLPFWQSHKRMEE